eukprot:1005013-Prorocentrum_lima.AAC.1
MLPLDPIKGARSEKVNGSESGPLPDREVERRMERVRPNLHPEDQAGPTAMQIVGGIVGETIEL